MFRRSVVMVCLVALTLCVGATASLAADDSPSDPESVTKSALAAIEAESRRWPVATMASRVDRWSLLAVSGIPLPALPAEAGDADKDAYRRFSVGFHEAGLVRQRGEGGVPVLVDHPTTVCGDRMRVVGLFNWKASSVDMELNLDRLCDEAGYASSEAERDPNALGTMERSYVVYDFTAMKLIGVYDESVRLRVAAHGSRVVVIREWTGSPQRLAIGDTISQGRERLVSSDWEAPISSLPGVTDGSADRRDTIVRLYMPPTWKVRSIAINGKSIYWEEHERGVVRFSAPDQTGPVSWRATFDGSAQAGQGLRTRNQAPLLMEFPGPVGSEKK